jgi:predicted nucleic-acid-binding protein
MKEFMSLQEVVEALIEESNFGADANFKIAEAIEDYIADESGLLRDWDYITEKYTESPSDYLFRIYDFFEYNIFEAE